LFQNAPNPFNPSTRIDYVLPAEGTTVTIRVYDVRGRYIATLFDGWQGPGRHTVSWNGRDHRGQRVASGIYFCWMRASGRTLSKKMALVE
jgi:flagellar hook assembly protein FlgD